MPLLGYIAPLWIKSPQNPELMLEWPADLVNQLVWYVNTGAELSAPGES